MIKHGKPNGESERLKQGEGEIPGPMKSAHGKNSETPVSASLRSFSSAAGVPDPSTEFLEPLGVP